MEEAIPTNKELIQNFKEKINSIKDYADNLTLMTAAVSRLPTGQSLRYGDRIITQQDVLGYKKAFHKELQTLVNDYQKALKPRRRKGKHINEHVIKLSPTLINFFTKEIDSLGYIDVKNKKSKSIASELKLFTDRGLIMYKSVLVLCAIYMYRHNLQCEGKEKRFLKANDHMNKYLATTFKTLSMREVGTNSRGNKIQPFDPQKFTFTHWASIVSLNKEELTSEDRDFLSKEGKNELIRYHELLSSIRKTYKTPSLVDE
jgi:hypothetical protein